LGAAAQGSFIPNKERCKQNIKENPIRKGRSLEELKANVVITGQPIPLLDDYGYPAALSTLDAFIDMSHLALISLLPE
jgi:hypothetical protein